MMPELHDRARHALQRGTEYLVSLQDPAGFWKAELQTNVTMDAEDLLLREFLGIRDREKIAQSAAWIRSQQHPDGWWSIYHGGPANLSTTVEAYVALRLADDPVETPHMQAAAEYIRASGGLESTRVFTRIWLALFGLWSWDDLPPLPPEVILLPPWFPLNIYDFGCWARQTIVPLTVVASHRPCRPLPFDIDELRVGRKPETREPLSTWAGRLQRLDGLLHRYEARPWQRLRRHAKALALEWIIRRQESDGGWGGIQPPWVYSLMALHLEGYPLDHPVIAKGLEGLDAFTLEEGDERRLEACQSPVWDTALSMVALRDAGLAPDHPSLLRGAEWLLGEEVRIRGDWAVRRPDLEPGGWAFEFANDNYPDVDDTAEVVLALEGLSVDDPQALHDAIRRGVVWTYGMQSSDDGFAAFDADNTRELCRELPFCDFGEVIDPPSADVTAHAVEMFARLGDAKDPRVQGAIRWLLDAQEPDGAWFGRWGANLIYGTGAVVPALVEAGQDPASPAIQRAVKWLCERQNADGGWGESLRSYEDVAYRGRGESTPSQTSWALLALIAAGIHDGPVARGVDWLARNQREDGGWDEEAFTGTGFPGDFYIRYHMYRTNFPVMALGRFLRDAT